MDLTGLSDLAPQVAIVFLFLVFLWKIGVKLGDSLDNLTKSNNKIATATTKSAKEAEARNGHLAEMILTHNENAEIRTEKIITAVQNVKEQNVEHMVVDKQEVK